VTSREALRDHVRDAYRRGREIALDGAVYGPDTAKDRGFLDDVMSYYPLLAGHAAIQQASTVIEVGTHFGGSTLALLAGMRAGGSDDLRLVTLDVTDLNRAQLDREPEIIKLVGDTTDSATLEGAAAMLEGRTVDLMYIDALKTADFVVQTLHNAWRVGLHPRTLILDDIQLSESMRSLWTVLDDIAPDSTYLISDDYPEIRDPKYGFAIIDLDTADLAGRGPELMERLGFDPQVLDQSSPGQRFVEVAEASPEPYQQVHPGAPVAAASSLDSLSLVHELAWNHIDPRGDIVEFGADRGEFTHALAVGLEANRLVGDARSRVHAYEPAGEALDELYSAIGPHSSVVNVYPMPLHVARWCGRPISLLVTGTVRAPRAQARLLEEFVPWLMVGSSVIVMRDVFAPWRAFQAFFVALFSTQLRLLRVSHSAIVLGYEQPIDDELVRRVVEGRFSAAERADVVHEYSRSLSGDARTMFHAQATRLALGSDDSRAATLLDELDTLPEPSTKAGVANLRHLWTKVHEAGVR
jgi:predicted O-methyltransferase YrrM